MRQSGTSILVLALLCLASCSSSSSSSSDMAEPGRGESSHSRHIRKLLTRSAMGAVEVVASSPVMPRRAVSWVIAAKASAVGSLKVWPTAP